MFLDRLVDNVLERVGDGVSMEQALKDAQADDYCTVHNDGTVVLVAGDESTTLNRVTDHIWKEEG